MAGLPDSVVSDGLTVEDVIAPGFESPCPSVG